MDSKKELIYYTDYLSLWCKTQKTIDGSVVQPAVKKNCCELFRKGLRKILFPVRNPVTEIVGDL